MKAPDATAPERALALDMVRRGLPVAPLLIGASAAVWGLDGALSSGFGIFLVLGNLVLSAAALTWAARISPAAIFATALGGFAVRMGLLVLAVAAVREQSWVEVVPLGLTIVVTHLGLLVWESRYVSATLAFPALKPRSSRTGA
ncbi:MAG: ATP synthase subunit I [Actinobacteria bacterium]|nr:ATP synthase subunit I [Actinomycetota bacterium]